MSSMFARLMERHRDRRNRRVEHRQPEPPVEDRGPLTEDGRAWSDLSPDEQNHLNHTVWDMRAWSSHTNEDRDIM